MKALITKTSDWDFNEVINDFTLSEASLKELTEKYRDDDYNSFVISLDCWNKAYDIIIEIYDDYRE